MYLFLYNYKNKIFILRVGELISRQAIQTTIPFLVFPFFRAYPEYRAIYPPSRWVLHKTATFTYLPLCCFSFSKEFLKKNKSTNANKMPIRSASISKTSQLLYEVIVPCNISTSMPKINDRKQIKSNGRTSHFLGVFKKYCTCHTKTNPK